MIVGRLTLLLIALAVTGCATSPRPSAPTTAPVMPAAYSESACSALAFDSPLTANESHPELARAPRQPAAYLGYQDSTVESSVSYTDNLESSPFGDSYTKESVTTKSNTRFR